MKRIPYAGTIRLGVRLKKIQKEHVVDTREENDLIRGTSVSNGMIRFVKTKKAEYEVITEKKDYYEVRVKEDEEYSTATDFFVVDHLPEVIEVYGKRPKRLDVMFFTDDIDQILTRDMRKYRGNRMLYCISEKWETDEEGNERPTAAKRMQQNGEWGHLDYCLCPYFTGRESMKIPEADAEIQITEINDKKKEFVIIKDTAFEIEKRADGFIYTKKLTKSCSFQMDMKFILPSVKGILPYVIHSHSVIVHDNLRYILEAIKYGAQQSGVKGAGFLSGIPFELSKQKQETTKMVNGKPEKHVFTILILNTSFSLTEIREKIKEQRLLSAPSEKEQTKNEKKTDEDTDLY